MQFLKGAAAAAIVALAATVAAAQEAKTGGDAPGDEAKERIESMTEQMQTLQTDMDKLKRFKFSGFLQPRWETAENKSDTVRVTGNPPAATAANNERFYIRRARFKLTYDAAPLSKAVLSFDGSTAGSSINIRMLDAYVQLLDPWTAQHQHSATIGQMNIPFGYEIEQSDADRELPERSRAENVLFPGERDRGLRFLSQWTPQLETAVALFNGNGIADGSYGTADPTRSKDLVARARYAQGRMDGALSLQVGNVTVPLTGPDVSGDRARYGADAQTYYELPRFGGGTLRGELFIGHDVNADSVRVLTTTPGGTATGTVLQPGANPDHFVSDFTGWYVMAVQNFGDKLQAAMRFDAWDPNTDVAHDQYERWSLGLNYFYDAYTRLTVSYDVPITDAAAASGYDDPHDNLWTVQIQLKY